MQNYKKYFIYASPRAFFCHFSVFLLLAVYWMPSSFCRDCIRSDYSDYSDCSDLHLFFRSIPDGRTTVEANLTMTLGCCAPHFLDTSSVQKCSMFYIPTRCQVLRCFVLKPLRNTHCAINKASTIFCGLRRIINSKIRYAAIFINRFFPFSALF